MASLNEINNKVNDYTRYKTKTFKTNLSNNVKLCTVKMIQASSAAIHLSCTAGYNATLAQAASKVDIFIRSSNTNPTTKIGIACISISNHSDITDIGYINNGNETYTIYITTSQWNTGILINGEHSEGIGNITIHSENISSLPSNIIREECEMIHLWRKGDIITNACWNDYAELFERGEQTEAGDIIALDTLSPTEQYIKADSSSKRVIGVHSDTYGHLIGGEKLNNYEDNFEKFIPIGLAGRVNVKVKGKVELGDYIVPSEEKGIGRAYNKDIDDRDLIIGYLVEADEREDVRRLKMFINKK